jgi:hypothetical protein
VTAASEALKELEDWCYSVAQFVDAEAGCVHNAEAIKSKVVTYYYDDDEPTPLPANCAGWITETEFLPLIEALRSAIGEQP